jgi:hypothetical protein
METTHRSGGAKWCGQVGRVKVSGTSFLLIPAEPYKARQAAQPSAV